MTPFSKDLIQVASWAVAVMGGLIAAFVAISQLKSSTEQRKTELRWRQANAAREIINDIHSNYWAKNAVTMLDWSEGKRRFKFEEKASDIITQAWIVANRFYVAPLGLRVPMSQPYPQLALWAKSISLATPTG